MNEIPFRKILAPIGLFCLLAPQFLSAQNNINFTTFFQEQVEQVKELASLKSGLASFKTSWLEELEVRTRTRDFELDRQRYIVRLTPSTRKIRKAQQAIFEGLAEEANLQRSNYLNDFIEFAYKDWLKVYELAQQLAIHQALSLVYLDIETVLLKMSLSSELKPKDLIEIQNDITQSKIAVQSLESALVEFLGNVIPDFSDLLPLDSIQQLLLEHSINDSSNAQLKNEKVVKAESINAEIALEQAESQKIFDYFQLQYEGPHNDGLNERISIGAGLKIPFSSDRQLKLEELKLEQELLQENFELDQALLNKKLKRKKQALQSAFNKLNTQKSLQQIQQQRANALIQKLSQEEGTSPLLYLYQKATQEKQAFDYLELELEIYENYIDYLALTGQLFEQPFQNFLVPRTFVRE